MKNIITIIIFFLGTIVVQSQTPIDPDGDPGQAVPIDNWIIPLMLLGLGLFCYTFYKKQKQVL
ncbi:hypothetical protein ACFS5J_03280 [Flavobacterium chuncheonense]|uniref:Signal peptidase n=1 Tax=Flavobacterium chuncheonense TaxID=2026653 RepID=A0ABW5YJF5_9FLAO